MPEYCLTIAGNVLIYSIDPGELKTSVVITTWNRRDMVVEAIDSVLAQVDPPDQVIVVDDGSTDGTLSRLSHFCGRIDILAEAHRGVSAARNRGLSAARFPWVAFLDSDDIWRPRKLERQKQRLAEKPGYWICYTDEEWRRNGQFLNPRLRHRKFSGWIYLHCLPLCIISPSSVLVHRRVFETVGAFDTALPACEDYDLWLRVACSFPILFCPERLIVKRAGPWPQLSQQHSLDKYRIIALAKMLHSGRLSEDQKQSTRGMLREKCRIYAQGCRKHGRLREQAWAKEMAEL